MVALLGALAYLLVAERSRASSLARVLEGMSQENERLKVHLEARSRYAARELELVHRQLRRRAFDLHDLFTTSGEIRNFPSLEAFLGSFLLTLIGQMRCQGAALFLPPGPDGGPFALQYYKGIRLVARNAPGFARDSELHRRLTGNGHFVPLQDSRGDGAWARETAALRDLGFVAAAPLMGRDDLLGAVMLGEKLDGMPYRESDWELLAILLSQAAVTLENAHLFERLNRLYQGIVQALVAAIDARDPSTLGHTQRTAWIASRIAQRMGMEGEDLDLFQLGALLHDIGKIGLTESILRRSVLTPINAGQVRLIREHPVRGAEILGKIPYLHDAVDLARHHHERYDGTGYPDGLAGEEISLGSRILGVADAYEAMTAPRKYKKRRSPHEALQEIVKCAGTQFDPRVVDALVGIVEGEGGQELFVGAVAPGLTAVSSKR
jgi:putative nucleotidyltransferase with HDIG domain